MSRRAVEALVDWSNHTAEVGAEVARLRVEYAELRAEIRAGRRERWAFFALGAVVGLVVGYVWACVAWAG